MAVKSAWGKGSRKQRIEKQWQGSENEGLECPEEHSEDSKDVYMRIRKRETKGMRSQILTHEIHKEKKGCRI